MSSSPTSSTRGVWRRLLAHRSARWALTVIGLLVLIAVFGPMLVGSKGLEQLDVVRLKNRPPSLAHPFGTDEVSRDVFARVITGARISLAISTIAAALSMTLGTAYGMIAGYFGGRIDTVMMRILDACLAIPRVMILIAVLVLWNPGLPGVVVLLGATGWFGLSRLVRAETLAARRIEYVDAARALGASHLRILWRHLLPNVIAPVLVTTTLAVGNVIVLEAGLSFLGVGVHPPTPTCGTIFFEGSSSFAGAWWVAFFPGVAIVATVLAFNVLGDALRDVLDPRSEMRPVAAATE